MSTSSDVRTPKLSNDELHAALVALREKLPPRIGRLIDDCANASFECGEHNRGDSDEPYETLFRQALDAEFALVSALLPVFSGNKGE